MYILRRLPPSFFPKLSTSRRPTKIPYLEFLTLLFQTTYIFAKIASKGGFFHDFYR